MEWRAPWGGWQRLGTYLGPVGEGEWAELARVRGTGGDGGTVWEVPVGAIRPTDSGVIRL